MRNHNPRVTYMKIAESRIPEMRYNGKGDFFKWQSEARAKLKDLLGLDLIEKCDNDFLKEEVTETDEYTQVRFSFQSEPGYYVPAYIRIPKNFEGKIAFTLQKIDKNGVVGAKWSKNLHIYAS